MVLYAEAKAAIAGTTSIQGNPDRTCHEGFVRNSDHAYRNGWNDDPVDTSISDIQYVDCDNICERMASGDFEAWLIHLAEGVDESSREEYFILRDGCDQVLECPSCAYLDECGCMFREETTIIHGTAMTAEDFSEVACVDGGMELVWSPRSNLNLYCATTDVVSAKNEGVTLALAPDWSISGSRNILDSLRCADELNQNELGGVFSDQELVEMVTINAAKALSLDNRIGRLAQGFDADITVISGGTDNPYRALIDATVDNVLIVFVDGKPIYGERNVMDQMEWADPDGYCEIINVCDSEKKICIKNSSDSKSLNEIIQTLDEDILSYYGMEMDDLFTCVPPPACSTTKQN